MKKTLLLVFIHGFKGDDTTFKNFPQDLSALLSHTLPKIDVVSIQYPKYETRGDLKECVARFKEWLQNKVIDLEVAHSTSSPTVDPSVHVILCGHSMGGIVAAETLLSILGDEPIAPPAVGDSNPTNATIPAPNTAHADLPSHDPSTLESSRLIFPYVRAILAFDTPYLGISPGVLAHGAEEQYNHASTAYKAFSSANSFFGWNKSGPAGAGAAEAAGAGAGAATAAAAGTAANESGRASPGSGAGKWGKWGRYAMVGGAAAAAVAGVAGAAYLSWNQINEGLAWAGSHLEFVGCLARGAELQQRVERVVGLTTSHGLGFADFYTALGAKAARKTRYAGAVLGSEERTFCIVPKGGAGAVGASASTAKDGVGREPPSVKTPPVGAGTEEEKQQQRQAQEGAQLRDYAKDTTKNKGRWVRCVNDHVTDEISAHSSMFAPDANPDYHSMVPRARDQIHEWVDMAWYDSSESDETEKEPPSLI